MRRSTSVALIMTTQWLLLASLAAALALSETRIWFAGQLLIGLIVMLAGMILVVLAFAEHRKINRSAAIRAVPLPLEGANLVTTGIYSVVRHPIYTAAILLSLGSACVHGSIPVTVVGILIAVFYYGKSGFEESLLRERYPEYESYAARSGRLLPRSIRKWLK